MSIVPRCALRRIFVAVLLVGAAFALGRPGPAHAQASHEAVLQEVQRAFTAGDAKALLGHAADRLEINLFNESTLYSRSQALYVMQAFFRENPPVRFVYQEHQPASGSWFSAAVYWCEPSERPLRVYVRLRESGQGWELREIRVDPHRQ